MLHHALVFKDGCMMSSDFAKKEDTLVSISDGGYRCTVLYDVKRCASSIWICSPDLFSQLAEGKGPCSLDVK